MNKFLLIAIAAILVFGDQVDAQQNRRGRFFQKIKDDIFGSSDKAQSKQPTPANSTADPRQQNRNYQSNRTQSPQRQQPTRNSVYQRQPSPGTANYPSSRKNTSLPKSSVYDRSSATPVKTASSGRKGFGFSVRISDDDDLVVAAVDRYGNAAKEGIRRGDIVSEIGGIEATSAEEFQEIAKVMNQGDQMEFKIKRGSKEKKIEVMYGEMPEAKDLPEKSSVSDSRRYDFAPPANDDSRSNSVLQNRSRSSNGLTATNPVKQNFSDQSRRQIQYLTQTIENQNRQIQILQQKLRHLERQGR